MKTLQYIAVAVVTFVMYVIASWVVFGLAGSFADGFENSFTPWHSLSPVERVIARAKLVYVVMNLCMASLTSIVMLAMFWRYKSVVGKLKSGAV